MRTTADVDWAERVARAVRASELDRGVALGFDRLVMLALGAPRIDDVIWTPLPKEIR